MFFSSGDTGVWFTARCRVVYGLPGVGEAKRRRGVADGKTGILQGGSGMALRRSEGNKVTFPMEITLCPSQEINDT